MAPQEKTVPHISFKSPRDLAHPEPGEEVVITGCSGFFPESENVYQLQENLFSKVDMVTEDFRRWKTDHPDIPKREGKVPVLNKFDASFFGIHYKQATCMDPLTRILLEKCYEAIVDAGINPARLRGKRIGIVVGSCYSESEPTFFYEDLKLSMNGSALTGSFRSHTASRVSYWLGITGPSLVLDTACSSSMYSMELGYKFIRDGYCDACIVAGTNLCLNPIISLQFARLGVLSPDGVCRTFDDTANGYVRSEAIAALFLTKSRDAKRIYATVVHAKTNCDGYKPQGITYPSGELQTVLLNDFYKECSIDPNLINYVEAHGTGTKAGDYEELNTLENIYCKNRKDALYIGSVKTNLGHTEPVSGICSIAKVLIAFETGMIAPNINYNIPRQSSKGLLDGYLKVVTDITPLKGDYVSINSFGFGGANAHVLLKKHNKTKIKSGAPTDALPRLVVASGRTEESVDIILKDFESRPVDVDYVHLVQDLFSTSFPGHLYRGYTLLTQNCKKIRSIKLNIEHKRPVWFVFSGMGSQWPGMGKALLNFPVFAAAINKCEAALKPHGVDVVKIITSNDPAIFDNIINCFVGIAACQVGLVDIMKAVEIEPDGFVGHSVGELGCSYMDGSLTAEQTVLIAYYRGVASLDAKPIKGLMAAVGLGAHDAKQLCPPEIEVACHNGPNICTLSGPEDAMKKLVKTLQQHGVFAKEINSGSIAYHSKHIASAGPVLLQYLKKVIPSPKPRSSHWISSSVPQDSWKTPLAQHSSAEYHTNNFLNPVLFEEASRHIPYNAITIEIAPHGLLQPILNHSLHKATTNTSIAERGNTSGVEFLLTSLGKLYELGLQPKLTALYPPVQYPVSRGTPMISPLIRWSHTVDWLVPSFNIQETAISGEQHVTIHMDNDTNFYLTGHIVDGRNLFPATGYIELVWNAIRKISGMVDAEASVVFEDVRFHRATNIPKEGSMKFVVMIQRATGKFEVEEGGVAIVTGTVRLPENISEEMFETVVPNDYSNEEAITLTSRDIYKELRLRGYQYQGFFRSLVSADSKGQSGRVLWQKNWVAFMDNMLQIKILQEDTRGLFVPTSLDKLVIDVKAHKAAVAQAENSEIPVFINKEVGLVWGGGVQVLGLKASAISKRKALSDPVIEKHVFVANVEAEDLDLKSVLRICTHIALEDLSGVQVKAVELFNPDMEPLSEEVAVILGDLPLLQAEVSLLADPEDEDVAILEPKGYKIENHSLSEQQQCQLVILPDIVNNVTLLQAAVNTLAKNGCIVAREQLNTTFSPPRGLQVVFEKSLEEEKIFLLKKGVEVNEPVVIHVNSDNYDWLPKAQAAVKNDTKKTILMVAQGEPLNGVLGLVNCIQKETPGNVKSVFIVDKSAPAFDPKLRFYQDQLEKNLAVNVYKNGKWGSYRHLLLEAGSTVNVPHAFVNVTVRGDLSSLRWIEGNINLDWITDHQKKHLVQIYYSALNFRDIMTATGKLAVEVIAKHRLEQSCVQGIEFSGRDINGRRVMGMGTSGALATMIMQVDQELMWEVPDHWTLEDAATVPVVYGTAYFALIPSGRLKKGDSVLIHAGSGGVGQAAINICLHMGCTVFTTVGTEEKRQFIKKKFPQLTDRNIGNSRDTSFEQLVKRETNGRGVDIVLNSLAEEKLQASLRCLAPGGRFLEIGKVDLSSNNPLGMEFFLRETSFHGIMLDTLFDAPSEFKAVLNKFIKDGIKSGAVQPLSRTVFADDEVEKAFRYMAGGKHIGKVLIKIRPEEEQKVAVPKPRFLDAIPCYYCHPEYSYIVAGGLGGFGLELADWLVLRGARKLILTSRSGLKAGYQFLRVKVWESYGAKVEISVADITTESGVKELLTQANKLGQVDAIFNLAVVLRDALFENQTDEDFKISAGPKATATHHMDKLSRQMCPHLRHFVVFSSVSCGRGNAGQTNYGMNNSIMERICEARQQQGLHGLAIQWGAVGDVGLVADMQEDNTEIVIGGTIPQKITSCLEELDRFLKQPYPVVSSMVVAEKRTGAHAGGNLISLINDLLGIRDPKTVNVNMPLSEMGMDSLMAVEVKQTLERNFEIFLTPQEIRKLTYGRLQELSSSTQKTSGEELMAAEPSSIVDGLQFLMRVVGDEKTAAQTVYRLPSMTGNGNEGEIVFSFPGIEGVGAVFEVLSRSLNFQTICLQLGYDNHAKTIAEMANSLLPYIQQRIPKGSTYKFIGYSFGGILAMELALHLDQQGYEGRICFVDSSPEFVQKLAQACTSGKEEDFDNQFLNSLYHLLEPNNASEDVINKVLDDIKLMKTFEEKVEYFLRLSLPSLGYSDKHKKALTMSSYNRIKACSRYQWHQNKTVKAKCILIRPETCAIISGEDYGLSKCCDYKVEVKLVPGNHVTILDKKETADIINQFLS